MGSRVPPLAIPLDIPDTVLERLALEETGKAVLSSERSSLLSREQNGLASPGSSPINVARREIFSRSISGSKSLSNDDIDLEDGKAVKERDKNSRNYKPLKIHNQAILSGLAYCLSSCSMILVNKFVLSSYDFNAGISLMLYQNFVSVVIVSILSFFGVISTERLTWRLIKAWLPVNVIFVGMLITSIFSLKYINVAMVTVLKNVTNVITAIGEVYLFKKQHDNKVWAALFLMIISAVSGGITDLSFHRVGYAWQIVNCFLTASYSLTLRRVMDTAKQVTKSGNLNEFSMVLLNNSLSLPLGVLLVILFNEVDYLSRTPLLKMPMFWLVMTLSGVLGLAISFTSMWFLHQTGATTYRYAKILLPAVSFFISSLVCASTLSLDAFVHQHRRIHDNEFSALKHFGGFFGCWLDTICVHLLSIRCIWRLEGVLLVSSRNKKIHRLEIEQGKIELH